MHTKLLDYEWSFFRLVCLAWLKKKNTKKTLAREILGARCQNENVWLHVLLVIHSLLLPPQAFPPITISLKHIIVYAIVGTLIWEVVLKTKIQRLASYAVRLNEKDKRHMTRDKTDVILICIASRRKVQPKSRRNPRKRNPKEKRRRNIRNTRNTAAQNTNISVQNTRNIKKKTSHLG